MIDIIVFLQFLFNIVFIIIVAFVLYSFLKKSIKKWTYDASYDALIKFEKYQQDKDIQRRVNQIKSQHSLLISKAF